MLILAGQCKTPMFILRPEDLLDVVAVDRGRIRLALGFAESDLPKLQSRLSVSMRFSTLEGMSRDVFLKAPFDTTVTPLFGEDCDAEVVAQELTRLGFAGVLQVLCPPLPNQRMVEREVRRSAEGFRVQFLGPSIVLLEGAASPEDHTGGKSRR
jgi:hypothetical protein